MSSGLTAVDVQDLAGDERRPFEIEDPVNDVFELAQPAKGMKAGEAVVGGEVVRGDLMIPGATAFTRTPRDAYSIASERVTASGPPFVRATSAEGLSLTAWSTMLVIMLTTWPLPWVTICRMECCVMWKNPARFTAVPAA